MAMAAPVYYTADMVRALPDDGDRYETVYGELLVTPAPRAWHQEVLGRVQLALGLYLKQNRVGHLFASPADISWTDDTLVQPDLFVVDFEQARTMDWVQMKRLLLVIEVMSPSTARYDRFTKRRLYQDVRIPAYWIVNSDDEFVEVWTPETELPEIQREGVVWSPDDTSPSFAIKLKELFKPL